MSSAPWSLHLLSEVLSAFSLESSTPLRDVVSRVAEAVDAEITAILRQGVFTLCTGLTKDEQPALQALAEGRVHSLTLSGGRIYHLFWASLGAEALLVVGRAHEAYNLEERALLRGMGRSIQLSTQVLDAVRATQDAHQAEKVAKEDAIREATIDYLTGLPNRRMLLQHLGRLVRTRDGVHAYLVVLFIDLDRFKQINDIYGHKTGDQVLRMVAGHLCAITRAPDMVGRISGDEFLMILSLDEPADAEQLSARILDHLETALQNLGIGFGMSASIGIALAEAGDTPETLVDNADMAMYAAKQQGRNRFARYHAGMRKRLEERHQLREELRDGLLRNELRAWLQPIVSTAHGGVVGFEALARWQHPRRGTLFPDQFLGVAEEGQLLRLVDVAVLRDACAGVCGWDTSLDGIPPRLSVNISAVSLADPCLSDRVKQVLIDTGFPPRQLFVEITETTLIEEIGCAYDNISALGDLGIRLAIDDFGTGYSSLIYLKRFPVGIIKIDRSFVDGLGRSAEDEVIVETLIKMGCSLGLEVVAEGVESSQQAEWLLACGCHYLQGHLYGAPAELAISEIVYRDSLNRQLGLMLPS
jgi:diguanylate cyclase (GGDEF)-like protein